MKRFCISVLFVCSFGLAQPAPAPERLPIKRVVLYKNGVGYFEHVGPVRDNQDVAISFTSGQLNDVLKSLTVLDLNGGRITGVGYGSQAPAGRQLGDLRLPIGQKTSLTEFLEAIRGARVEIKSGTLTITGRLLSVERKTRISGGTTLEVDYVSLITDAGEVRTTELSPAFSVRLMENGLPGKVERYLDLASASRDADVRRMVVSTTGSGERSIFLSYISEVPVWKATYRIVLDSKNNHGPLLQGWAIVDNTVGQDWENVQLSLVAGAPQSFVQNLSQPFYARRPVVPLPQSVNARPQTFEATVTLGGAQIAGTVYDPSGATVPGAVVKVYDAKGALAGSATTDSAGRYTLSFLPDGPVRLQVDDRGFKTMVINGLYAAAGQATQRDVTLQVGATSETITVTAEASRLQTESSELPIRALGSGASLGGNRSSSRPSPAAPIPAPYVQPDLESARASLQPAALAQELGDLFEYKLKQPVTIERNRSALVPIVQSPITAEKVSVWNDRIGTAHPQRALWLTNSTGMTLDGGSFSVLEEETFAGEGIFEPIRPGEKRLVSYAADLAINAGSRNAVERERVSRVRVAKGILTQESEVRDKKTYTFRNEDAAPRVVIIEHPVRAGYELRGDAKPVETTATWLRFRLPVEAKQTASLVVEEAQPSRATYEISDVTSQQIALFVSQRSISPAVEDALRKILAQKDAISRLESQQNALDDEANKIFDDQQRLRENMKALKGTADEKPLVQRYTAQLNDQENRLEAIRGETKRLEMQTAAARDALDKTVEGLSFDEKL